MLKRFLDMAVAAAAMLLLAPVIIVVWCLVRTKFGTPVLFRQVRPGLGGKPFDMFKFRTMTDARDTEGNLLPDSERLTPFGRLLRASSLDELPEIWNVFKGDMSLVGPRPLLMEYLPLYSERHIRRHNVRPGITGWAQINGRNAVSWEDRFEMDVWYVENQSLLLDMKIFMQTFGRVLARTGVSGEGTETMTPFRGYR